MLPGMMPAVHNLRLFKNSYFEEYYAFVYDLADDYELIISAKKKLSDADSWFEMEYDFYTSADPKKFRIFMEPTASKDIDTSETSKGYWSLEARSLTDPDDRSTLVYGEIVVRERTSDDEEVST